MHLVVNGQTLETEARTLGALMAERKLLGGWLATARNGEVVPANERNATLLAEGDRIEILGPMQGG